MSGCLIVTTLAEEFATEISRLAGAEIPLKACANPQEALQQYAGETVLFGSPGMIVEILAELPAVDWVQSSWAGVTPLIEHDRRDYVLTGVKDVFGPQMSEYTLGYLLAHELKVLGRMHAQREHTWDRMHSGTLTGKRLGVMGTGSIGQHIARSARCLGLQTTGLSRSGADAEGFDKVMRVAQLHEFLARCDYLVAVLPDTPDTLHLLDAEALAQLPPHAYFVNVGRSNVIDDHALVEALNSGILSGAALDVFDEEPLPDDSPLWDARNLSVTAHIAAISHPLLIVPIFIENYKRYVKGQTLNHIVNFDTGY